jgi:hypothetical protein
VRNRVIASLIGTVATWLLVAPVIGVAFDWTPSVEEIQRYRKTWNPLSNGPMMLPGVDIQPKGQWLLHPYIFSQVSERQYGNDLRFATGKERSSSGHLYSVQPLVGLAYGLTDHIEVGASVTLSSFWNRNADRENAGAGGRVFTNTGLGDTSLAFKYRPIIQDPDGLRPSLTFWNQLVLPSSQWAGTEKPPGGFAPLGRLPASRFGSLTWTEGVLMRKILQPFRFSGGIFYSHHFPGVQGNETTYPSDIINGRLVMEHFLNADYGLAYNLELVTLHSLPWRADGHPINRSLAQGFTLIGLEPVIQFRLGKNSPWVGAVGALFTIAGQNALDGIYPNFSLYYYWSETGKVIMR